MERHHIVNNLLQKFIKNTISESELKELFDYLDRLGLEHEFLKFMDNHWKEINENTKESLASLSQNEELFNSILEKIGPQKPIRKLNPQKSIAKWSSIAAVGLLLFGLGYFYFSNPMVESISNSSNEDVITLKLGNGDTKIISDKTDEQIVNEKGMIVGTHTGNTINYQNNISDKRLSYNTLTVPYGKRFKVILSDGTIAHLNAGTSMKYPIKFIKGRNREVTLEGEAYFEVSKDSAHPFLVNSRGLDIRVLGTKFNITSYAENESINTVLAEGSVEVTIKNNPKSSKILKPGQKATWHKKHDTMTIEQVAIENYTAWMEGKLILDEVPFENIQKKLERQYNVAIINNNKNLKDRRFTARFDIEDIDQVMKSLSISASFNYSISENQVIINQINQSIK